MKDAQYWAYCKGGKGTKATYKHISAFSPMQARIEADHQWKWEHPGEALIKVSVDCVETSYEKTTENAI